MLAINYPSQNEVKKKSFPIRSFYIKPLPRNHLSIWRIFPVSEIYSSLQNFKPISCSSILSDENSGSPFSS